MADGDGGVFCQKEQGCGLAHNVGAPHHHGTLAGDLHAGGLDHPQAACRCAGGKAGLTGKQAARIDGGETVHVLFRRDGGDDGGFINVGRQRQLHQDAVNGVVRRQGVDPGQQFLLGGGSVQPDDPALDAAFGAIVGLAPHIDLAGGVLPHQQHRQAGGNSLFLQLLHLGSGFGLDGGRQFLSVDDGCTHNSALPSIILKKPRPPCGGAGTDCFKIIRTWVLRKQPFPRQRVLPPGRIQLQVLPFPARRRFPPQRKGPVPSADGSWPR